MIIVYLDFLIFKTNPIGGKYHDTEYYEGDDFRMKSFCDMTIYKKILHIVNMQLGWFPFSRMVWHWSVCPQRIV